MKNYEQKLNNLNINPKSSFFKYLMDNGGFDNDNPELDEVYDIDEIYDNNINGNYWSDQFPKIEKSYLMISSIEGEGSYFYSIKEDAVYDVSWNEMKVLVEGKLDPRWVSFTDFESDVNED